MTAASWITRRWRSPGYGRWTRFSTAAHPEEVATALGLHRKTVYGWLKKYRDGGQGALLARPVPGRPPRLAPLQMRRLWTLVAGTDPRQLQFDFALWTRWMVRDLIKPVSSVDLTAQSVGRLLRRIGMSPQRPITRAYEQDSDAVRHWKTVIFPKIKAEAAEVGATIYFADEAGIRSDYHSHTTWAPVGQTPVVKITGTRFSVNMISAVTAKGALRFAVFEGTTTAKSFIEFCKRLVHDSRGPACLIVDGHPCHRAKAVTRYVASTSGKLTLFFLPGYSPELNPDEWVWKNVKHDRIGKAGVTSKDDLKAKAIGALRRLQKSPAWFGHSSLIRIGRPGGVDAREVVAEDVGGAAAVGTVHDGDLLAGQADVRVEGHEGGVAPAGDLAEEDPCDDRAGEVQPEQAGEVVGDGFGAEVDGNLDGSAAVGGGLLGGSHGHVGGAEIGLFRGEGGDARAAAHRGVADRHCGVFAVVSGERRVEERRVEG